MKSVVRIITKQRVEENDVLFWSKKSPAEKLTALQIMREQYIRFFNKGSLYRESRKGLRRIYKIVKQAQG